MASFGLHVGNSSACIAVERDGRCDVVANHAGDRVTPSVVGWVSDKEVLAGLAAKQLAGRNPNRVVLQGNKTLLGRTSDDEACQKLASSSLNQGAKLKLEGAEPAYDIHLDEGRRELATPAQVHTRILKYMHGDSLDTVLTVPLNYSNEQRAVSAKCAEEAGFNVIQVINEPAAALLAHSVGQLSPDDDSEEMCVVYRVGGTSLDCTLVRITQGFMSILASVGKDDVGGDKITKIVEDHIAEEFQRKYKVDPRETKRGRHKLLTHGESAKHILSTLETANCHIESFCDGVDFSCNITRARFDNELAKILPEYVTPVHEVLAKSNIEAEQVQKLVLCGGTAKIPKLQKSIASIFGKAEVLNSLNPDEIIALGAAKQAALLCGNKWTGTEVRPVIKATSKALLFRLEGLETPTVLVPALTPVPVRKSHRFDNISGEMSVMVFLHADKGEEQELAHLKLTVPEGSHRVSLSAHFHRDGSLHLAITEKTNGNSVQKMLATPVANNSEE